MGPKIAVAALAASLLVTGCSFSGACVSTGGSPEECKQDWDKSDCDNFQALKVNGATWTFYPGQTCADRGFTSKCAADPYSYCRGPPEAPSAGVARRPSNGHGPSAVRPTRVWT